MIDDKFQSTLSVRRATTTLAVDAAPVQFQSTLSVRRATYVTRGHIGIANISIHALRKESDRTGEYQRHDQPISIHALRKESDPTLSGRGLFHVISIHALRKESDRAAGHFCPLSETQASCLALSISNNTTGTTNNMPKTSSDNVRIPAHFRFCSSLRC